MVKPSRIVLVDDREDSLRALEAVLAPLGQELVRADSGEAALKQALRGNVAAILLDVVMPALDGLEVVDYLKALEQTREIPVILLTAVGRDLDWVYHGYERGALDYLVKPVDPWALRAKVRFLVHIHQRQQDLESRLERAEQDSRTARERLGNLERTVALAALTHGPLPERVPQQRFSGAADPSRSSPEPPPPA